MIKLLSKICIIIFFAAIGLSILWAKDEPQLNSPGGAEMDFTQNITKCYGTDTKPVEVRWKDLLLKAHYLEYYRNTNIIKGQEIQIIESAPANRVINCGEAVLDLNNDLFTARKNVKVIYDARTNFYGNTMVWDRKKGFLKLSDQPQITFDDWQITGERLEVQLDKGSAIFFGPVQGKSESASFRAGQLIFKRDLEKIYLEDNPVMRQGKNEMNAVEIVYDFKAKKAFFNNQMELKVME